MTALNKKGAAKVSKKKNVSVTGGVSYNGNPQTVKIDAQQLYELIVMSLYGKDSYYESTDVKFARLEELVKSVVSDNNLDFVANAILHARHVMNIRSMPLILAILFAKALREQQKSYSHLRSLISDVIARADQITDMYAVALKVFGSKKAIPIAIKRGVADAFNKFNEYQFAKYNKASEVKLRDVLRIVHPSGKNDEQGKLFEKIVKDTLEVPYTWEVELSKNGQFPESERKPKNVLWTELVQSKKLGYMALLRNLRNLLDAEVEADVIETVADRLEDPEQVRNSKQLPFRFTNALNSIKAHGNNKLIRALSRAVDSSLGNLPKIGDNVWIIVDCSGSMGGGYSSNCGTDGQTPIQTASLFAAALAKAHADSTNLRITFFSDRAAHVSVNTDDSVLSITEYLISKVYGGGTALQAALDLKAKLGFEPDAVIVLSDMAVDTLTTRDVSSLFIKDCVKVAINLNSYDSTPLPTKSGWYQLGGWSERLFDFIPAIRNRQSVVSILSRPYIGVEGIKTIAGSISEEEVE